MPEFLKSKHGSHHAAKNSITAYLPLPNVVCISNDPTADVDVNEFDANPAGVEHDPPAHDPELPGAPELPEHPPPPPDPQEPPTERH